tara:strand:- start:644 stop:1156 length:513 start_codon:yes stop_codon:yes gene_type:complete
MIKEIWNKIEEELTGEYARGYALAQHLGCADLKREVLDADMWYDWGGWEDYGGSSHKEWVDETDHIICTDEEADELAYGYITDGLWTFRPSFLAGETGIDINVFEALAANQQCEGNNDALTSLIKSTCGLDEFVQSAIGADGRGHFIAHYDHNENEVTVGDTTFYIYRMD